jgi:hypothetical protein
MENIRNEYIPFIVKDVISKKKPETESQFIEFAQALYDQIKKRKLNAIRLIEIQNGRSYEVGNTVILVGIKKRSYTITEIVDETKPYYDSKEYEFHVFAKTESNTTVLLAKVINCPVVVEYEI